MANNVIVILCALTGGLISPYLSSFFSWINLSQTLPHLSPETLKFLGQCLGSILFSALGYGTKLLIDQLRIWYRARISNNRKKNSNNGS